MKKLIADPMRPEGHYYGYDSAAECLADYEADLKARRTSGFESVAGYACLWVFLAAIVGLSILAGIFQW